MHLNLQCFEVAMYLLPLTAGANNVAICWGPVLGSKAVTYRTAVVLGGLCQVAGVLAFGPRTYTVYGGFLDTVFDLNMHPELTLYAIMWTVITPVVFQLLAIRCQILVPAYLGTGKTRSAVHTQTHRLLHHTVPA